MLSFLNLKAIYLWYNIAETERSNYWYCALYSVFRKGNLTEDNGYSTE